MFPLSDSSKAKNPKSALSEGRVAHMKASPEGWVAHVKASPESRVAHVKGWESGEGKGLDVTQW